MSDDGALVKDGVWGSSWRAAYISVAHIVPPSGDGDRVRTDVMDRVAEAIAVVWDGLTVERAEQDDV